MTHQVFQKEREKRMNDSCKIELGRTVYLLYSHSSAILLSRYVKECSFHSRGGNEKGDFPSPGKSLVKRFDSQQYESGGLTAQQKAKLRKSISWNLPKSNVETENTFLDELRVPPSRQV